MQTTDTAALLQAAPEEHSRRCALAKSALDSQRWPAAACGLRHAAALALDWASRARAMADWCDAQAEPDDDRKDDPGPKEVAPLDDEGIDGIHGISMSVRRWNGRAHGASAGVIG